MWLLEQLKLSTRKHGLLGFTLIELIIEIVILGVLAITVVPKFINLEGDARAVMLKSIAGDMKTMNGMVYRKALLLGKNTEASNAYIDTNLGEINIWYGYLEAKGEGGSRIGIFEIVDVSDIENFALSSERGPNACTSIRGGFGDLGEAASTDKGGQCYIDYKEASSFDEKYVTSVETSGCYKNNAN